jgi:hypothetical protein
VISDFLGKPGFADSGFTGYQHEAAACMAGAVQRRSDVSEGAGPRDERKPY